MPKISILFMHIYLFRAFPSTSPMFDSPEQKHIYSTYWHSQVNRRPYPEHSDTASSQHSCLPADLRLHLPVLTLEYDWLLHLGTVPASFSPSPLSHQLRTLLRRRNFAHIITAQFCQGGLQLPKGHAMTLSTRPRINSMCILVVSLCAV